MRVRSWLLVAALGLVGCSDDAVGGGADGSGTGEASASGGPVADGGSDTADGPCVRDEDCDDGDPCTADVCDEGVCMPGGPVLSLECRPIIDVEFPARGATVRSASPVVTVTGQVGSGAGAIQWLHINGEPATLDEQGRFSHDVVAQTGGNTLVFETIDEHDVARTRVQSFLWSTDYHQPAADDGMLDEGLVIYLDQESLDDGDPSTPVDDLATLMGLAMGAVDLASFIDPTVPMASVAGYDVYVLDLRSESSSVSLQAIDGGLRMTAVLAGVEGDLDFQGVISSGGGFSVATVTATVDLMVDVDENHQLAIAVLDPRTAVDDLELWTDNGLTNFLLTLIEPFIIGGVVSDLEASLTEQLTSLMGPAVGLALGAMAPNTVLTFPRIGAEDSPIEVALRTDFQQTDFDDGLAPPEPTVPQGGVLFERGGAVAEQPMAPYENLGVPDWAGCGEGAPALPVPREAPLEILLTDDLLNQLLHGAWHGGLLEFDMPPELLGDDNILISDLEVGVSGMLAPTASDCAPDGRLRMHIGDIRIDGSLVLGEQPVTFVAYSSLVAGLDVVPTETGIGIVLGDVEQVDTELNVGEDHAIEAEPTLKATLETQLVNGVLGGLAGEGLGGIELPQLDLSASLGLPPGTAAVNIVAEGVERSPGVTIISGHL